MYQIHGQYFLFTCLLKLTRISVINIYILNVIVYDNAVILLQVLLDAKHWGITWSNPRIRAKLCERPHCHIRRYKHLRDVDYDLHAVEM